MLNTDMFPTLVTSGFPLSMGTALAMETLFNPIEQVYDVEREVPDKADLANYDTIWFNIRTLYRNLMSAMEKEDVRKATPEKMAQAILNEVETIQNLFSSQAPSTVVPSFYYSTYEDLEKIKVEGFSLRPVRTDNQIFLYNTLQGAIKILEEGTDTIVKFKGEIKPTTYDKCLVLTHHVYDLIGFDRFSVLELLESNTGAIKNRGRLNTKYTPMAGEDLSILPFHRKILLVFGDRVHIKPYPPKLRKNILEIARNHNWNSMTTMDRVNLTLNMDLRDLFALDVFKRL